LEDIDSKYQVLKEITGTKFFKNTNYEQKAEASILVIINISYHISSRADIHGLIEQL